jgi:hypothetical protein
VEILILTDVSFTANGADFILIVFTFVEGLFIAGVFLTEVFFTAVFLVAVCFTCEKDIKFISNSSDKNKDGR